MKKEPEKKVFSEKITSEATGTTGTIGREAQTAHVTKMIKQAKLQREADLAAGGKPEDNEDRLAREEQEAKDLKAAQNLPS